MWERKQFVFKKCLYRTINRVWGFSDTLKKKNQHGVCFLCSSVRVVCFIAHLWAACPGILWKVVVRVVLPLIIKSFYDHLCLYLFPKWEPGLKCWVYLETHHVLSSQRHFIVFTFGWHTTGNGRGVPARTGSVSPPCGARGRPRRSGRHRSRCFCGSP